MLLVSASHRQTPATVGLIAGDLPSSDDLQPKIQALRSSAAVPTIAVACACLQRPWGAVRGGGEVDKNGQGGHGYASGLSASHPRVCTTEADRAHGRTRQDARRQPVLALAYAHGSNCGIFPGVPRPCVALTYG